ncbi:TPA: hypothetical protein N0F65_010369 [Lagenidium giganteum]|uniref:Uncharacterized protein n=1 Tax=Lagenidium giganteum TaxID=4803 RepID=A0AAV2YJ81_9STRA|nr:TPA: hypothetical protein N0F65_010369 [Lagenidium giganteum]
MAKENDAQNANRPKSKVIVVASRYAQALQKTNLEAQSTIAANPRRATVNSTPTHATATPATRTTRTSTARPASASSSLSRARSTGTASATGTTTKRTLEDRKRSRADAGMATPTSTSLVVSTREAPPQDLRQRLREFRASKELQRQLSASARAPPISRSEVRQTLQRPGMPPRIANGERLQHRLVARSLSRALDPTTTPRSATPRSASARALVTAPSSVPRAPSSASAASTPRSRVASAAANTSSASLSEKDELDLIECMYYQLRFVEAKARQTFEKQQREAERQILAVYETLQAKMQLLHDTTLRLDREKHIQRLEQHLEQQAMPLVQVATQLPACLRQLHAMCTAVEASLHRMPTPRVTCHPVELKRQMESLTAEIERLLSTLHQHGIDRAAADAVSFERSLEHNTDQISSLLMQVGNLIEELLQEVNSESSMAIHQIQQARIKEPPLAFLAKRQSTLVGHQAQ